MKYFFNQLYIFIGCNVNKRASWHISDNSNEYLRLEINFDLKGQLVYETFLVRYSHVKHVCIAFVTTRHSSFQSGQNDRNVDHYRAACSKFSMDFFSLCACHGVLCSCTFAENDNKQKNFPFATVCVSTLLGYMNCAIMKKDRNWLRV